MKFKNKENDSANRNQQWLSFVTWEIFWGDGYILYLDCTLNISTFHCKPKVTLKNRLRKLDFSPENALFIFVFIQ